VETLQGYWGKIEIRRQTADDRRQGAVCGEKKVGTSNIERKAWQATDDRRQTTSLHEAKMLLVDSTKARRKLGWKPRWDAQKTLEMTANWYRNYYENGVINTEADIDKYEKNLTTNRH